MGRVLVLFMLLWSSGFPGFQTKKKDIDDIRLLGGSSRCSGVLQVKRQGVWKEVDDNYWDLKLADVVCRHLDCGSVIQALSKIHSYSDPYSSITPSCLESRSRLKKCLTKRSMLQATSLEIICSDSVRLVNGTSLCSGRLEVKSNQSNQSWSSVCEDDFDLQDAEVVCRELGCGAPSFLQGALYGDMEAPVWTKEFQCRGHESALLDCESSHRNTCSSGKAAGLTCSEPGVVRLVGGASRCDGTLEMKHRDEWKPVADWSQNLRLAGVVCGELGCGFALSLRRQNQIPRESWGITSDCNASSLLKCFTDFTYSFTTTEITCSDSQTVRLVNGTSFCSGRLEVKSTQSTQSWSSVCEDDFDLQEAEVVCRELGCGAPSVLQGALYGDMEAPVWTKEFQCRGHESALLDCDSSDRNTCSSGKAVGLTCSGPDYIRLVGEPSRCAGKLEMKNHREWRQVVAMDFKWNQMSADAVCRKLDCGSAVPTSIYYNEIVMVDIHGRYSAPPVWSINSSCVQSKSALKECVVTDTTYSSSILEITCSDLLAQPNISPSPSPDAVYKAKQRRLQVLMGSIFTIRCSVRPQYPGGSFKLIVPTPDPAQNYTLPAVNHSAHFLFSAADSTHRGEYRCVYHLYVFSHNFSSESRPLHLTPAASLSELIIRLVVLLLGMMSLITALCVTSKASRKHKLRRVKNSEI